MPNGHASGESVVGVTIAFTILATIGCFMRLYTRFIITGSPGLDDGFTALATVSTSLHRSIDLHLTQTADLLDRPYRINVSARYAPVERSQGLTTTFNNRDSQVWHGQARSERSTRIC